MITIVVLKGSGPAKQAIQSKVAELKERKKSDPIVSYAIYERDGEFVLDFVPSDGDSLDRRKC